VGRHQPTSKWFGRYGALLPLFRLVGALCIAALWRVKSLLRHRSDRPKLTDRSLDLEIHRRCFAAVLFDLILDVLPFIERAQSGALDGGHVYEHLAAARLRLKENIALDRIAPHHHAARLLISQLTSRDIILIGGLPANAAMGLCTSGFRCVRPDWSPHTNKGRP